MQCDYCDSKATVFFTQIIGGLSKKSCLCENCAAQNGVTDPDGFLSDDVEAAPLLEKIAPIGDLGQSSKASGSGKKPVLNKPLCSGCGFSLDDLKKIGRLGCSECYQSFRGEIEQNLGGMHKDTTHVGRVPAGMARLFEHRQALEKLETEMEAAIAAEDYEKAGALRDKIEKLAEETSTSNTNS